jgi:ATP-dependent helicase/nuclease subunit B
VVPSRSRAYALRLAHAAAALGAGREVWASADVLPLSAWLRREAERAALADPQHAPRLLSDTEEWFLWRQCTREHTRSLPLIDPASLAGALQRSAQLAAQYHIVPRAGAPDSEASLLAATAHAVRERCRALRAASVAHFLGERAGPGLVRPRALALRGFDSLTPQLRRLAPEALESTSGTGPAAAPALLRVSDPQQELESIAAWCRERLERAPDARLLVMLPPAPGAHERLAALIRAGLDPGASLGRDAAPGLVGIEAGEPLARSPLTAHALTTLGFLAGQELETDALCAWLRSPQWARPDASLRARLAARLREGGALAHTLRSLQGALLLERAPLKGAAREMSAQLTRAAAALAQADAAPRRWSERCRAALAALGWPGTLGEADAAQPLVLRWHELLEEFGALSGCTGTLARLAAWHLLRELAARTLLRPADEDPAVTLSGVFADPIVRYDGIWVAGLSAEAFPQPVQPDPFLALAAQRAAGVPGASAASRLAQAQTLLGAWRAATAELVLSAPVREGDVELMPSPLLAGFAAATSLRPARWLPASVRRADQTELLLDADGSPWKVRERLPRGTRTLDLQNQCPFRAYAELRLGAVPPEAPQAGIAPTARGLLLHAALELIWRRLGDSDALHALDARALGQLIAQSVAQAARATLLQPPGRRRRRGSSAGQLELFSAVPPAVARECRRAERLIRSLCELERERTPFRVEQIETPTELTLGGATLHLRMDRVDRLAGGALAVLDYKSGSGRNAPDWYGERPTHPQLLAYAAALGDEVAALATVSVAARRVGFEGLAREGRLLPRVRTVRGEPGESSSQAWAARQQAWRAILERLIGAFLAGDARVDPRPGACRHCHVTDICRIPEQGLALGTQDSDEDE